MPGVFNLHGPRVLAALHRLAALHADVACLGHGDPVTARPSAVLREAADKYGAPH